jgi:pimeloyl-ACP methyl ester carboxylesterase
MSEIQVTQGTLRYRDEGSGPVVVLIHGLLVNGSVWDPVAAAIGPDVRVIVPELPLGSHSLPMNADADLTPPGLARLIAELLERLELDDVTLVGNDTGGALCQVTVARHPQRIGRLVLTNCDAFENFPPQALIVWGTRDRFFPFADAERLAAVLPNARVERIESARTFVQLDAPQKLAELIAEMATAPDTAPARRS